MIFHEIYELKLKVGDKVLMQEHFPKEHSPKFGVITHIGGVCVVVNDYVAYTTDYGFFSYSLFRAITYRDTVIIKRMVCSKIQRIIPI